MLTVKTLPKIAIKPKPLRFDKTKDECWTLQKRGPEVRGGDVLCFDEFLREDDNGYINGSVMIERSTKMGDTVGQLHAEELLQQKEDIPEEFRQYILVFTETIWSIGDKHFVTCLSWNFSLGWRPLFRCLRDSFGDNCRIVRRCK